MLLTPFKFHMLRQLAIFGCTFQARCKQALGCGISFHLTSPFGQTEKGTRPSEDWPQNSKLKNVNKKKKRLECKNIADCATEPYPRPSPTISPGGSRGTVPCSLYVPPLVKIHAFLPCYRLATYNHLPTIICIGEQRTSNKTVVL